MSDEEKQSFLMPVNLGEKDQYVEFGGIDSGFDRFCDDKSIFTGDNAK